MSSDDGNSTVSPVDGRSLFGTRGKTKPYFIPIDTIPGETKPYTLPAGASACPVEACPQYSRLVHPHWRLNEHMKVRHGWPRKITQPNTDRRITNPWLHADRPEPLQAVENPGIGPALATRKRPRSSSLASPIQETPASSRPRRVRKPTAKGRSEQENIDPSESDEPLPPPKKRARLRTSAIARPPDEDVFPDPAPAEVTASEPPRSLSASESQVDTALLDLVAEYVRELQSLSRNRSYSPDAATKYKSTAETYQDLIDADAVRVNGLLPLRQTEVLLILYKRLAEREGARAEIHSMSPSKADSSKKAPLATPTAEETSQSQSMSEPRKSSAKSLRKTPSKRSTPISSKPGRKTSTPASTGAKSAKSAAPATPRSAPKKIVLKFGNSPATA